MASNTIRFSCTSLQGTNKKGILTKDEHGYYSQPIGGLNVLNSAGMYYTYQGAKALFEESSAFMRRVRRGALRGENGHPKRGERQSIDEFASRVLTIDESRICVHWRDISLDFNNYKDQNGQPIVAIIGSFTPAGELRHVVEEAVQNGFQNSCFSVRSFTEDYYVRNVLHRDIRTIVTFDFVNEPGISHAEKYKSLTLESYNDSVMTRSQIERACQRQTLNMGMESGAFTAQELMESFNWKPGTSIANESTGILVPNKPAYMRW